jgi:glycosyltransferase involved in cell wall biosynthesis
VIVQGRIYGFDLAREFIKQGHDVTLFTNYPPFIAARFGIPKERVRAFLAHGIWTRLGWKFLPKTMHPRLERISNAAFGRWAARKVLREEWDVVLAFSGVAEETLRVLHRASSHIAVQRRILDEEHARTGAYIDTPSDWIVAREKREYVQADVIHLLCSFAVQSFLEEGVDQSKLYHLTLGVEVDRYRPSPDVIERRCQRILSGEPLRILNVGTFCYRKGAFDWVEAISELPTSRFALRFVGPVSPEARELAGQISNRVEFRGKFPQYELPREYEWGDVFVLPTLEDGFPVVLTQSLASGIPIVTTPNCSGFDLVASSGNGWSIPIRNSTALVDRLLWLDGHRQELVAIVRRTYEAPAHIDWAESAKQATTNISERLKAKEALLPRK